MSDRLSSSLILQLTQPYPLAAQILTKHKCDNYEMTPILTLIMEKSCILFEILSYNLYLILFWACAQAPEQQKIREKKTPDPSLGLTLVLMRLAFKGSAVTHRLVSHGPPAL